MKLALVFPGQGSQAVGMGRDLYDQAPESRAIFDEVDDALGEKLSTLIFEGPEDALTLTANAQPALMAVSLAAMRALEARGFALADAAYVAGHSLGEYSALAAAGALGVGETARLLRIRGEAMQAAVPAGQGAMAAIIGLDQRELESVCVEAALGERVQIANDNGGGQLVISGDRPAVDRAMALATERGARRAIALAVSAPFHSALMQPAADRMAEALMGVHIAQPKVPLIANVLAAPVSDPERIRAQLVEQVTGRVRWSESMSFLADDGVDTLFEVGAGKVLSGLARRIDKRLAAQAVGTPAEVDAAMQKLAGE